MTHDTRAPAERWDVIVLAGDRGANDPVARATGAGCKAMAPIAGKPLLARVLDTITEAPGLDTCHVVGPRADIVAANPTLASLIGESGARWHSPADSPVASAMTALADIDSDRRVLITTADHALLTPRMIDAMCQTRDDVDLTVGLIERARVSSAYPASQRTAIRLGGRGYCGCNLFALHSARGRDLVAAWRRVEDERKHPARVVSGMLGWGALIRYALRRLTLEQAFNQLSRRSGVRVAPSLLTTPEAAIDVDSVADLRQVEAILNGRG
ncbi:nucleotidyltransferase family protein [Salinisphaera sp. Q1T1-3]|uniref:nucleotidyltransferase family protein n=1 Tax=Salinisphaera sp. Q1T1-3 TaxID=2321229 RepID=UPI000E751EE1|nr:nucleotidyltransferase family protein [Salinisphaera sp. Q1T1-3]RJS92216.1 MobA-like NTP transferase domain containing protein [Salinisphaera sp. Q1T1-3]